MLSLVLSVSAATDFSPAFFWSPREVGLGRNTEHLHEASARDLEGAVAAISGRGKHGLVQGGEHAAPEVQLVFLADELTTEAVRSHPAQLQNLENIMKTSPSSLSVPFTTRSADAARLFDDASRVVASEAEEFFRKHVTFFHDGVPNTVVVELSAAAGATAEQALAAHDAIVGRVSHIVARGTAGNYAGLLTGMQKFAKGDLPPAPRGRRLATQVQVETLPYLHMTPTLLTAYMIMFLLLVIFLNGFCCLFSLQTPKKFDTVKAE